jgi:tetratricopeptide (TPR) repeat protein
MFKKGKLKKADDSMKRGRESFEQGQYQEAAQEYQAAQRLFEKANASKESRFAEAWSKLCEGQVHLVERSYIEAMKAFGRANTIFSRDGHQEEAIQSRVGQAASQEGIAKERAANGKFIESARLYESAGAAYENAGLSQEAAKARARSFVQRAAASQDDFQKAEFLSQAVNEFRKGREHSLLVEGHAHFYRGRSLINVKVESAIDNLARAAEAYGKAGAEAQVKKVRELLEELTQRVRSRPAEFERKRPY